MYPKSNICPHTYLNRISIHFDLVYMQCVGPWYPLLVHVGITAWCPRRALALEFRIKRMKSRQSAARGQLRSNWCIQTGVGGVTEADVDVCRWLGCNENQYGYTGGLTGWSIQGVWWMPHGSPSWIATTGGWTVAGTNMSIHVCWRAGVFRMAWWGSVTKVDKDGCIRRMDCNRNQYEYAGVFAGLCIQGALMGVTEAYMDGCIRRMDYNRNQYEYIHVLAGWCSRAGVVSVTEDNMGDYEILLDLNRAYMAVLVLYDSSMTCNVVIFLLKSAYVEQIWPSWNYCHGALCATACYLHLWVSFTRWCLDVRKLLLD